MFARLVNSNPEPARLKSVRVWLSASDHLPSEVRQRLRQFGALLRLPGGRRIPPVLLNGYGMVELGGLAMMGIELSLVARQRRPVLSRAAVSHSRGRRKRQAGARRRDRRVPDPPPRPCSALLEGQRRQRRSLLTSDGWLRTGDLATRNRLGLIRLVGRMKDVIKSGGYSVYVRELEEAMLAHPAVARAVAFGLPHKEKGEIPVAAVELHTGSLASESDLLDWCRQNLARLQSAAPHLDSRAGRLAAESQRQNAPAGSAGAVFGRDGLMVVAGWLR